MLSGKCWNEARSNSYLFTQRMFRGCGNLCANMLIARWTSLTRHCCVSPSGRASAKSSPSTARTSPCTASTTGFGLCFSREVSPKVLEDELHLQIDAAVRASGRKGPGGQGIRLTKERRAENAVGRAEIHDVQNVVRGNAESQVVTAIGGVSHPTEPTAPAKWSAAAMFTA